MSPGKRADRPLTRLLLFAHGSRDPRWRAPFERLCDTLGRELGEQRVRLAYMEFAEPTLLQAADEASADWVTELRVLPMFLASGAHVSHDIPAQVDAVARAHPELEVRLLPPVGEHPRLVATLEELGRLALEDAEGG